MNVQSYLARINFSGTPVADLDTLQKIHECHIQNVPFENLDIYYKKRFTLDTAAVYNKVVNRRRGGFCYELNFLLRELLSEVGFSTSLIAARIFDDTGIPGPRYDHLAIHVHGASEYLADVGFGDLFLRPLKLNNNEVTHDGKNYFRLDKQPDGSHTLCMSNDNITFQRKYSFELSPCEITDFENCCHDKQVNPNSFFVKNLICTRSTLTGRNTIFNDRFFEHSENSRAETLIADDHMLRVILREKFDIQIKDAL